MAVRIAINGYGRIGRCVLKALYESSRQHEIELIVINDLSSIETKMHLTKYDSTHGKFPFEVKMEGDFLQIDGQNIVLTHSRDPKLLPWRDLAIDVVLDCTGYFTDRETAKLHLEAGAKKVLISAPGKNVDATIVFGVNQHQLRKEHTIVSNASCTTNCLAPLVKPLHDTVGIEQGLMNTIHAYTNDQNLLDGSHQDLRRARAAAHSIIPTKTGAASALGLVIPELAGKLDGFAMRVPVMNVSVVDLTFIAKRATTVEEINTIMKNSKSSILHISDEPLVSSDFNHCAASCIFDLTQTKVQETLVKVVAWYDNEWGFSNRMLDTAFYMMTAV